jgi:hypothetical protein
MLCLAPALSADQAIASDAAEYGGIELGRPFPDLWLPSAENGSPMSLAQFRGSKVILHVFASW